MSEQQTEIFADVAALLHCLALGAIGIINSGMSQAMATSYINVPSSIAARQMTNLSNEPNGGKFSWPRSK
jgi:hypothetical protein